MTGPIGIGRRLAAAAGALGWFALVVQLYLTLNHAFANGKSLIGGLVAYFGYFTILTNILAALTLTVPLVRPRSKASELFSLPSVGTGVAASIALVGIAYSLLLRHIWNPSGMQLVADVLLHDVMPVAFLLYWWLAVPAGQLRWTEVLIWMLYPLLYFCLALLRGALTSQYSYPFIHVGELGYQRVLLNATGILLSFLAIGLFLVAVGRWKQHPAPAQRS